MMVLGLSRDVCGGIDELLCLDVMSCQGQQTHTAQHYQSLLVIIHIIHIVVVSSGYFRVAEMCSSKQKYCMYT